MEDSFSGTGWPISGQRTPTNAASIAINLCGALFLAGWLLSGKLDIPPRGQVFLWAVVAVLTAISVLELARGRITSH